MFGRKKFGKNNYIRRNFDLPSHKFVTIDFDAYFFDTWDNGKRWGYDRYIVKANGN